MKRPMIYLVLALALSFGACNIDDASLGSDDPSNPSAQQPEPQPVEDPTPSPSKATKTGSDSERVLTWGLDSMARTPAVSASRTDDGCGTTVNCGDPLSLISHGDPRPMSDDER